MSKESLEEELPKAYDPKIVDAKWYHFWEEKGCFQADCKSTKTPFAISIPPPNVTGVLHMGHALVNTLQDILIRWRRMCGDEAVWVPGTDHAGIATQTVVERHLIKTEGKKRTDYTREEFLAHVWKWKEQNENRILDQLKKLGCSCDWKRLRFTMDEGNNHAVRRMFKKLYDDELIYRGDYLVNWDPVTQTALADDEVEYEERESFLWHFKYPLNDGTGFVQVATTRPETMLGDTAIAVSPNDVRYQSLIGKTVLLPIMKREIPIIADYHVDPEFGTGMVKVTPAHDPNDYQIGLRHELPFINIMTPDGFVNQEGGPFEGMKMLQARKAVVEEMEQLGFLESIEPYTHRVGVSYRSKATIEPYLSKQWFIKMGDFAQKMRAAVKDEEVKLIPQHWESTYFHWVDNLRDWCISRQLWWGHRIPIWYNLVDGSMICYDADGIPPEVEANPDQWEQDPDVLDTWFSSSLWPFSVFGWPEETPDLEKFYPNAVLITGHDILFFWVARMIMMGQYALGKAPFPATFLHGLIYGKSYWREDGHGGITYVSDKEREEYDLGKIPPKEVKFRWEKMSKSKGNIIDPLEIIDQYGTDAMRMALCTSSPQQREIDLDRRRFEEFKNFANKVWNGARFVFMNLRAPEAPLTPEAFGEGLDEELLLLEDHWILSILNKTITEVTRCLETYSFDQAAQIAYDFYWQEFCSYYVEISKPILFGKARDEAYRLNRQKLLAIILCQAMRLIHPMAPFITEEIFQMLKAQLGSAVAGPNADPYTKEAIQAFQSLACMLAPYPKVLRESDKHPEIDATFALVEKVVYTIRNIRGEMNLPPSAKTDIFILGNPNDSNFKKVQENSDIIRALIRSATISVESEAPIAGFAASGIVENLTIKIPLPKEMIEKEIQRLSKDKERLSSQIEKIDAQLQNKDFVERAPQELIAKQKSTLEKAHLELSEVASKLLALTR